MNKKILMWGTGKIAEKYEKIFLLSHIDIFAYVDSKSEKWGRMRNGIVIIRPEEIRNFANFPILIACADIDDVKNQIKLINREQAIISYQCLLQEVFGLNNIRPIENQISLPKSYAVLIDNLNGRWGGAEDWCHKVGYELYKTKRTVRIYEGKNGIEYEQPLRDIICKEEIPDDIILRHEFLINNLEKIRPFVLINVWYSDLLWAAIAIKRKYPNDVKIISSILNDVESMYENSHIWKKDIDKYICISKKIAYKLINKYDIPLQKVFYKEPFIEKRRIMDRTYSLNPDIPIKICFPCRLVRIQKRAHLVPQIISKLNSTIANKFVFNIVGDGECETLIREFVKQNKLEKYVNFYGKIGKSELITMLYTQDIYLNISEFEGTSLTMLEALASGCVPVVTNVSGVEEYIQNGKNGFISEVDNLDEIINNIIFLEKNRNVLLEYGSICKTQILNRCQLDKYIDFIEDVIW